MALRPCRECEREVSTEAPTCPHCGCPDPGRASAIPLVSSDAATPAASAADSALPLDPAFAGTPRDAAVLASASPTTADAAPGRKPLEATLGERILPGARGGVVALAAFAAAMLLLLSVVAEWIFGDPAWESAIQRLGLAAVLVWTAVGMASLSPMAHLATGALFVMAGGWCALQWLRDVSDWPWLAGAAFSALLVHYNWAVRKRLRTPGRIRFELSVQPFQACETLPGRAPQNALIELNNRIAEGGRVRDLIPEDVLALETKHRLRIADDLPAESQVLYARYLRHFLADDFLTDDEKEEIAALERLLSLPAETRDAARREIATWLYSARLEEALRDGRIDADERALLDRIVADLELAPDAADKLFRRHASDRVARTVRQTTADQRLDDGETAELHGLAARLGVSLEKGAGGVTRAQLDRYRLQWQAESGALPSVQAPLELARGEVCHFQTRVELITPRGRDADGDHDPADIDPGIIAVTSRRLLFLGASRQDVRLGRISGIKLRPDGVEVQAAGEPGRLYTFHKDPSEADLFVQILSRAMRAAGAGTGA